MVSSENKRSNSITKRPSDGEGIKVNQLSTALFKEVFNTKFVRKSISNKKQVGYSIKRSKSILADDGIEIIGENLQDGIIFEMKILGSFGVRYLFRRSTYRSMTIDQLITLMKSYWVQVGK